MPKHFVLNAICIMLFGLFLGYGTTHIFLEKNNEFNQFSENGSSEMPSLAPSSNTERTIGKIASEQIYQDYFDVRIKHELISKTADGHSIVKAIITAKKDLPAGLSFKWKLGQDVTTTSSEISGKLSEIKSGEHQEVFITVYGFNKRSQNYLSFSVSGTVENHKLHKETISASRPEDSFEGIVQQNHVLEQARELASTKNGKLTNKSKQSKKFDLQNVVK